MENDWRMQECMQTSFVPQTCICILPQNQLVLIGCTLDKAGHNRLNKSETGFTFGLACLQTKGFNWILCKRANKVSC
jgi:hypothetical protein